MQIHHSTWLNLSIFTFFVQNFQELHNNVLSVTTFRILDDPCCTFKVQGPSLRTLFDNNSLSFFRCLIKRRDLENDTETEYFATPTQSIDLLFSIMTTSNLPLSFSLNIGAATTRYSSLTMVFNKRMLSPNHAITPAWCTLSDRVCRCSKFELL